MAYTPTTWVDGTTPVNATNLNKMETGIAGAHAGLPPTPVNGQWLTASGGAMVWAPLPASGIPPTLLDAKGDLIGASANDTPVRIPGPTADGQTLIGDAASASGLKWGAPAGVQFDRPIQLTTPRTSSLGGNTFWSVLALTQYDWGHWEFVKDVDGLLYGLIRCTEARATPTVVLSLAANATAGITRMQVGYVKLADGQSFNIGAFNYGAAQDITVPGTAYLRKDASFALGTSIAVGDEIVFSIFHNGSHTNDTLAQNTLLAGAWLTGP